MITRSQYEELIKNNLKGVTWSRLKNALLGKELISFGGVVNELISSQYDTFLRDLAPDMASYTGLSVIGYNQQVCYDIVRPTKAVVPVTIPEGIAPFQAILTVGNNKYYNTSYIGAGQEQVTLSQGNLGCTAFNDEITGFGTYYQSGIYWANGKKYVKLPKNLVYESLNVYITQDGVRRPVRISDSKDIRVFRQVDNTVAVMLLDTESYDSISQVECYYLVATTEVSSTEDSSISGELQLSGTTLQVQAYEEEGSSDIAVARDSLVSQLSLRSSISTKEQIKQFVNSFPQVKDSNPELTDANTITVWVSPTFESAIYDDIQANLTLYGEMAIYWMVKSGVPVPVSIRLTAIGDLTGDERAEILTEVTNWIDENIKFDTVLTPAWVLQSVLDYANKVITSLVLDEQVTTRQLKLAAIPVSGTISFVKDGKEIAWDSRGYIRGYLAQSKVDTLTNIVRADKVFVVPSSYGAKIISDEFTMSEVSKVMWDISNVRKLIANTDYILAYWLTSNSRMYKLYQVDTRFGDTKSSLIKDPEQFVSSIYPPIEGYLTSDEAILDEGQSVLIGTALFNVRQVNSSLILRKFNISADGSKYVNNSGTGTTTIENVDGESVVLTSLGTTPLVILSRKEDVNYVNRVFAFVKSDIDSTENLVQVEIDDQESIGLFSGLVEAKNTADKLTLVTNANGVYKVKTVSLTLNKISEGSFFLRTESSVSEASFNRSVKLINTEYFIDSQDNQVKKVITNTLLFKVGDTIPALTNVGLIDYNNGQISLNTDDFDGSEVSYQTPELTLTKKSMYPKIKSITWYETNK